MGQEMKIKRKSEFIGPKWRIFQKKICFSFFFVQKNPKICARKEISFKQK